MTAVECRQASYQASMGRTLSGKSRFKLAMGNAGRLCLLIGAVLTVQAMIEVLYVQKVLQMGGSGIPLRPY